MHTNTTAGIATIDPITGVVTPIGPITNSFVQSLAFDPSGLLFGIGRAGQPGLFLFEFSVSTGAILSTTEITSNLLNPGFDNSLAIHPVTGAFYTVAAIEGGLYEVAPNTGVATRIGSTGLRNIRSLDFAIINTDPIPEPTTLAILGLGLVGLGVMRRKRTV